MDYNWVQISGLEALELGVINHYFGETILDDSYDIIAAVAQFLNCIRLAQIYSHEHGTLMSGGMRQ
jgi:hypothetical protein